VFECRGICAEISIGPEYITIRTPRKHLLFFFQIAEHFVMLLKYGPLSEQNIRITAVEPIARHCGQCDSEEKYSRMKQNMSYCHILENSSTFQMFCYLGILGLFGIKYSHNK